MSNKVQMNNFHNKSIKTQLEDLNKIISETQEGLAQISKRITEPNGFDHIYTLFKIQTIMKKRLKNQIKEEKDLKSKLTIC